MAPTVTSVNKTTAFPDPSPSSNQGPDINCSWAESGPNWAEDRQTLGYGLDVHVYLFGAFFSILLLYAIIFIITTIRTNHEPLRGRMRLGMSLHVMIAMSSLMRALSMFIDPYGSRALLPCPANVIIWSFGWPGIVSAYSIFFLAVLETTQLSFAPPRFQRLSTLAVIISINLAYVLTADLLASYLESAIISILLCELVFVTWGLSLSIGFVYVWWRIRANLAASCPRNARERHHSSVHGGSMMATSWEARRLKRLIAIMMISAIDCLILTLTHIVSVVGMFKSDVLDFVSRPWQWFAFQSGQRALEIMMCVLIAIAMKKSPGPHHGDKSNIALQSRLASNMTQTTQNIDGDKSGDTLQNDRQKNCRVDDIVT